MKTCGRIVPRPCFTPAKGVKVIAPLCSAAGSLLTKEGTWQEQ